MIQQRIVTLIIALILPVIMACLGVKFLNRPAKRKYTFLWYESTFLYKNPKAWDYIHAYCGKRLLWIGVACILLSAITSFLMFQQDIEVAFRVAQIMFVIHFGLLIGTVIWSNASTKEKFISIR